MHSTYTLAHASVSALAAAAAFAAGYATHAKDPADVAEALDVVRHAVAAVEEL